jgi:aspartate/methionine/tyrosine aminotransferase
MNLQRKVLKELILESVKELKEEEEMDITIEEGTGTPDADAAAVTDLMKEAAEKINKILSILGSYDTDSQEYQDFQDLVFSSDNETDEADDFLNGIEDLVVGFFGGKIDW